MTLKVLALAAGMVASGAALADDVRIGYVDMRKVMNESKAGKRARDEIEKTIKQRQESLSREEQKLKDMQQAYDKERLLLSEAQKQTKQKEFDDKLKAFQQSAANAEREIEQKKAEYTRKAVPEIRDIIRELAKEEKLTLVFERTEMPVLYAAEGPDLTAKVIQRLDAK